MVSFGKLKRLGKKTKKGDTSDEPSKVSKGTENRLEHKEERMTKWEKKQYDKLKKQLVMIKGMFETILQAEVDSSLRGGYIASKFGYAVEEVKKVRDTIQAMNKKDMKITRLAKKIATKVPKDFTFEKFTTKFIKGLVDENDQIILALDSILVLNPEAIKEDLEKNRNKAFNHYKPYFYDFINKVDGIIAKIEKLDKSFRNLFILERKYLKG